MKMDDNNCEGCDGEWSRWIEGKEDPKRSVKHWKVSREVQGK